jgi:glycosyltransferase involved in cell wall biosynthesis
VPAPVAKKLSVFFPMWNEEENIDRTVAAARAACDDLVAAGQVEDYEILIVDDASTDATGRLADEMAASDPRVRAVHHDRNRKLGGSIKTGFATTTGDLVLYTDADLPFDLRELSRACHVLDTYGADVVSAYRLDRTGEGYVRSVYSTLYNVLVRVVFGVKVRDVNFAGKLVRRRVFDHVQLKSEGSFIDAELIVRASKLGYKIVQIGVDYFPRTRGDSTLATPRVILTILRELGELRGELRALEPAEIPAP